MLGISPILETSMDVRPFAPAPPAALALAPATGGGCAPRPPKFPPPRSRGWLTAAGGAAQLSLRARRPRSRPGPTHLLAFQNVLLILTTGLTGAKAAGAICQKKRAAVRGLSGSRP